jgi:acetyl-CoA acetyltransferase
VSESADPDWNIHQEEAAAIVISLIYEMKKKKNKYGLTSLCATGGMVTAVIVEVL